MSTICPACKKEISIWEAPQYPAGWLKQHPEIAGMCWECFVEWREEQQKKTEEK